MSRSWRPRWTKPARSRTVERCSSSSSTSRSSRPARSASTVILVSTPKPAASGKQAARAAGERTRWPESGSRVVRPVASRISRRADPFASPKPPPCVRANPATTRSPSASTSGVRSPREIGVAEQQATRRCGALGDRQRLALAAVREPEHPRAGDRRGVRGRVARAVVGDDHLHAREDAPQLCDRRADPRLLVARRDQDRQAIVSHRRRTTASGSIGGRIPSSAVSRIP